VIERVDFDESPINAGDQRALTAWSDTPMTVAIKCFTDEPPPPGYKACSACGTIPVKSGVTIYITADRGTFEQAGGVLELYLTDAAGDSRTLTADVRQREADAEGGAMAAGA
jgi:hypothetical protein